MESSKVRPKMIPTHSPESAILADLLASLRDLRGLIREGKDEQALAYVARLTAIYVKD